jgi:hypothetical protein
MRAGSGTAASDEGSSPDPGLNDALVAEQGHGAARGGPGDLVLIDQRRLGRDHLTGTELTRLDAHSDIGGHLLVREILRGGSIARLVTA